MSETSAQPLCPSCKADRIAGAPMCPQCWAPFDEPLAATATTSTAVVPRQPMPLVPPSNDGDRAGAVITVQPASEWRHTMHMPMPEARRSSPNNRVIAFIAAGIAVLGLAVGGVVWHASSQGPRTDKERIAHRFAEIRPNDGVPKGPPFSTREESPVDKSAEVQEYLARLNLPKANDDLRSLQDALFEWSHAKITDEAVYEEMSNFVVDIRAMQGFGGPNSLGLARSELQYAIEDYLRTLRALGDWMSAPSPQRMDAYMKAAANSNVHWEEAVADLYTGAGQKKLKGVHKHT